MSAEHDALDEDLRQFMDALFLRRRRSRLTQKQVAARMGVSQSRVSAIERSDPLTLELSTVQSYVRALGGRLTIELTAVE